MGEEVPEVCKRDHAASKETWQGLSHDEIHVGIHSECGFAIRILMRDYLAIHPLIAG
jgi:hypothetical protein